MVVGWCVAIFFLIYPSFFLTSFLLSSSSLSDRWDNVGNIARHQDRPSQMAVAESKHSRAEHFLMGEKAEQKQNAAVLTPYRYEINVRMSSMEKSPPDRRTVVRNLNSWLLQIVLQTEFLRTNKLETTTIRRGKTKRLCKHICTTPCHLGPR